ncbi:MAG: Omp28-related outer membrane protein [Bacteroidetes bacterium]|nr:Omp28-related outer membrane protein [Bacteroidota bacterium]
MKNWISAFIVSALFVFAISCDKEPVVDDPDIKLPEITTTAVTGITFNSAISGGTIVSNGGADITSSGICWSKNASPTLDDFKTMDGTTTGTFISTLSVLEANTTYYVCAYASNSKGTAFGKILTFTTEEFFMASTDPENRVALLEDFTGVRCGYCPDGHARAKIIKDLYPNKFIIMAVHAGGYAAPAAGWANFTTPYGNAFVSQANVAGYPAGTLNRIKADDLGVSPQRTGGYAMSRNYWKTAAEAVMLMSAPVNIGAKATYNETNRELTVAVDLYYTADGNGSNYVNVAILQDKLISKQSGGTPDPNNYEQNHVLRDLITGQWGDRNETTTVGTKYSKTFTYTVPTDYNGLGVTGGGAVVIDDLSIVVFVCQNARNVLNALKIDVE